MRLHVEDVWGSSPLRLTRYAALFEGFPLDRMWQLTGVNHVLTWRKDLFVPSEVLAEFPQVDDTTYLHRLEQRNPRAWLAPGIKVVDDAAALPLLADHDFDLQATVLVAPESKMTNGVGKPGHNSIEIERLAPNRMKVRVDSEYGGMLVVSENWMPGWSLEHELCSDGSVACSDVQPPFAGMATLVPMRVNLSLVGTAVPAGSVTFELVYWPTSIRLGLWISGISILAIGLLALLYGVWRRKVAGV
jgi:hypothetical protein